LANYPTSAPGLATNKVDGTNQGPNDHAGHHDSMAAEINAIGQDLVTARGTSSTIAAKINTLIPLPSGIAANEILYYTGAAIGSKKVDDNLVSPTAAISVSKLLGGAGNEGKFLSVSGGTVTWVPAPAGGGGGGVPAALTGWYDVVGSYGAVRYGTKAAASAGTDSTTAIQNAINAAQSAGGGVVYIAPGYYRIATGLAITSDRVRFFGNGQDTSVLVYDDVINGGGYGLRAEGGGVVQSNALTADAARGQRVVQMASTAGYSVNDWVYVSDNWQISAVSTFQQRFITRVAQIISGTQLRLEESLPTTYHSANGGQVQKLAVLQDITLVGVGFVNASSPGRAANRANMIRFTDCINPRVVDCKMDGTYNTGCWFDRCRGILVSNCIFDHIVDVTGSSSASALCLTIDESNNFRVLGNTFRRVGQAIVGSFGTHTGIVQGNDIGGAAQWPNPTLATPTDAGGRGVKFFGGSNIIVDGNNVHDFPFHMIRMSDCIDCIVSSNTIFNGIEPSAGGSVGIVFDGNGGGNEGGRSIMNIMSSNTIRDLDGIAVMVSGGNSLYGPGGNNKVIGNTCRDVNRAFGGGGTGAFWIEESGVVIAENTILGYGTNNDGIRIQAGGRNIIANNQIRNGGSGVAIRTSIVTTTGRNRIVGNDTEGETLALISGGATADLVVIPTAAASANPSL
jgi:hypothetical protein